MATIDDLNTAVANATGTINALVAKVQELEAAAPAPPVEADYQPEVDSLSAAVAQADAVLNPPPPAG